jgi:hypothetical protein
MPFLLKIEPSTLANTTLEEPVYVMFTSLHASQTDYLTADNLAQVASGFCPLYMLAMS